MAWHKADSLDDELADATIPEGTDDDVELWAEWDELKTITYELDGGINNVGNPETFVEDDLDITLLDPTKDGFTFDGWFTDVELTQELTDGIIDVFDDITVYAKWESS